MKMKIKITLYILAIAIAIAGANPYFIIFIIPVFLINSLVAWMIRIPKRDKWIITLIPVPTIGFWVVIIAYEYLIN